MLNKCSVINACMWPVKYMSIIKVLASTCGLWVWFFLLLVDEFWVIKAKIYIIISHYFFLPFPFNSLSPFNSPKHKEWDIYENKGMCVHEYGNYSNFIEKLLFFLFICRDIFLLYGQIFLKWMIIIYLISN